MAAKTGARVAYEDPKWKAQPADSAPVTALIDHQLTADTPPEAALNGVLARYRAAGLPGGFRVVRAGQGWSIAPTEGSPLDARITLPAEPRSFRETVVAILAEVRRATGVHIESMANTVPLAWANREQVVSADNEPARDVLMKFKPDANGSKQLLWSLRYSPAGVYSLEWGVAMASGPLAQDAQ